jgi:hypothetical protein
MKATDTICWNLPNTMNLFGLENKRNCRNMIEDDICVPFLLLIF